MRDTEIEARDGGLGIVVLVAALLAVAIPLLVACWFAQRPPVWLAASQWSIHDIQER